jgi:PIN domain nuclease of toxin-antitoxin system
MSIGKLELNNSLVELEDFALNHGFKPLNFTNKDLDIITELPFHHQDPFDRLIIAQSMSHTMKVISDDAKFKAYPINLVEG